MPNMDGTGPMGRGPEAGCTNGPCGGKKVVVTKLGYGNEGRCGRGRGFGRRMGRCDGTGPKRVCPSRLGRGRRRMMNWDSQSRGAR